MQARHRPQPDWRTVLPHAAATDAGGKAVTLAASGLTLRRGKARVIADLSAALAPGQITAICGPNGAGKSRLLMALAGLISHESGRVTIVGGDLAQLAPSERARRIGFLPQLGVIDWDLSVRTL